MALNWVMLNPNRIPVPMNHEMTIVTVDSGAEVKLLIPDAEEGPILELWASGKLYLTDQRLIFISESDTSAFESLTVPLHAVMSTRFEQPVFGANYLEFGVRPSKDGGLTDRTLVEVRFKERAMFEFVSLLEKSRERAIYMKRQTADEEEGLPQYTTPAESSTVSMVAGVPIDNPPSYD